MTSTIEPTADVTHSDTLLCHMAYREVWLLSPQVQCNEILKGLPLGISLYHKRGDIKHTSIQHESS